MNKKTLREYRLRLHNGKTVQVFTSDEAGIEALQARLDGERNSSYTQLPLPLLFTKKGRKKRDNH